VQCGEHQRKHGSNPRKDDGGLAPRNITQLGGVQTVPLAHAVGHPVGVDVRDREHDGGGGNKVDELPRVRIVRGAPAAMIASTTIVPYRVPARCSGAPASSRTTTCSRLRPAG
jgi:hypothetical protein